MTSKEYKEEIAFNETGKYWEIVKKIDTATSQHVCLECDEIIEDCEAEDNGELCDYCYSMALAQRVNERRHPDDKPFFEVR